MSRSTIPQEEPLEDDDNEVPQVEEGATANNIDDSQGEMIGFHEREHPIHPYWSKACAVHPLLAVVQFIFSGYHVLTSTALRTKGVDALVFALYRELSASCLIAAYAYYAVYNGGHKWTLERQHIPRFLAMGLFSAGNVLGAVQSLTLISPTNFSVLQPSIPVFTMLLSVLFRMEQLTPLKALGLAAAVAGAVCVEAIKPDTKFADGSMSSFIYGNVVVILQCLSMASLLVAQKVVLAVYHPTVVTAWYYSIGSVLTLIICLAKNLPSHAYSLSTDWKPWLALGYAALFGTAFNYNAYSWAGTIVAPGVISIYSTLQPIGTAILSFMFLHAKATLGEMLGGILVVIGLVVTVAARDVEARSPTYLPTYLPPIYLTLGEILGGILVVIGLVVTVAARDIEFRLLRKKAAAAAAEGREGEQIPLPLPSSPRNYGGARRDSKTVPLVAHSAEEEEPVI